MDLPLVYDNLPTVDLDADLPLDPPEPGLVAIYALTDPRDGAIRYIGKSRWPRHRFYEHLSRLADRVTTHRARWVNLLCRSNLRPRMRVIAWVGAEEWEAAERAAIADATAAGCALTNATTGGRGLPATPTMRARMRAIAKQRGFCLPPDAAARGRQKAHEPEGRAKTAQTWRAHWADPAVRERLLQSRAQRRLERGPLAARVLSAESRHKLGKGQRGKTASAETKAKLSAARTGKRPSEETRLRLTAAQKAQWQDPEVRARRIAGLRLAWQERRRAKEALYDHGQ